MWFIWKERCDRIFEAKNKDSIVLNLEILRHIEFWSTKKKAIPQELSRKKRNSFKWKAPSLGNLKFNVDATWISESLPSTYAFILRNDSGNCEGGKAELAAGLDPQEAEAIRVWKTAVWANEKQIKNFSIEGDSESLCNYINGQNADVSWRAKAYMQEAHRLSHLCNNFLGFFFVPRLENQVVDNIAKFAKNVNTCFEWEKIPPICSRKQLLEEEEEEEEEIYVVGTYA
ncbi:uncharacterized protein LOC113360447 [Papaver somniferum]|uniref:uncharacterized protein LOC113360447 n=1 Tax=Papaver somniferum TaxID=3469 RepID=UPI000E7006BF|nr:uncharacterized protein LOC113360447 [Papaver somniferum]